MVKARDYFSEDLMRYPFILAFAGEEHHTDPIVVDPKQAYHIEWLGEFLEFWDER